MVTLQEITMARGQLLKRVTDYFTQRPDVVGVALLGSLAAETADAYSDFDKLTGWMQADPSIRFFDTVGV